MAASGLGSQSVLRQHLNFGLVDFEAGKPDWLPCDDAETPRVVAGAENHHLRAACLHRLLAELVEEPRPPHEHGVQAGNRWGRGRGRGG